MVSKAHADDDNITEIVAEGLAEIIKRMREK